MLWVQNKKDRKLMDLVPTQGCVYIAQFLKRLSQRPLLEIPSKTRITLFTKEGIEVNPGDKIETLKDAGKRADSPLLVAEVVKSHLNTTDIKPIEIGKIFSVSINQSKLIKNTSHHQIHHLQVPQQISSQPVFR
jgi:hypothetical protein